MNFSNDFFLKHRLVVMKLSRDFLVAEPDQQLQTIDYYIEKFNVSRGTIQAAMQFLIEKGCISTQFRGHLGTYLLTKDIDKLWGFTGIGTLTGAMPIPLETMASGIATGICECMRIGNIPFNCIFIQGSRTRVNGLIKGKFDFIVVTRLAEKILRRRHNNIKMVMDLPDCQYNSRYILLFKDPSQTEVKDGMIVALDPTSMDQEYLTKLVCKNRKNIIFKQTPSFLNTRVSITSGEADVTVANTLVAKSLGPKYQAHIKELRIPGYETEDIERLRTPVILLLKDDYGLDIILKQVLKASIVSNSQKKVMAGEQPPNYY